MNKIHGFFRLIRPLNCTMMGFATLIGVLLVGVNIDNIVGLVINSTLAFFTVFALTGASMAINDYYDKEIDAINEPNRPIPSGIIKPIEALALAIALICVGLIASFLTNMFCFIVGIIALAIFLTYSTKGKQTGLSGNFLVSACVALPFIYGSLAVSNGIELNAILFSSLAFLSNTGREITKGIVDIEGDRSKNIRTIAVVFGSRMAAYLASVFYLSAVILSALPWRLNLVSTWYIPPIILTDLGFVAISILLIQSYSRENARKVKKLAIIWMITGLLSFLFGIFR